MKQILDYTISKEELAHLNDKSLADLLIYTTRDKCDSDMAEKLYWWCVEEINKRIDDEAKENGDTNVN